MGISIVLVVEGGNIGERNVGKTVQNKEKPGCTKGITFDQSGNIEGLGDDDCQYSNDKIEDKVVYEVGSPVSIDVHTTDELLVFRPVNPFLDDKGNYRCKFKSQGYGEDEASVKTGNQVVQLELLIGAGQGMV